VLVLLQVLLDCCQAAVPADFAGVAAVVAAGEGVAAAAVVVVAVLQGS
jgi:hypothetical protein